MIKEHLTRLGKELGIKSDEFTTEEVGLYRFEVNRDIKIDLLEDEYGLYLKSSISEAPSRNNEEIFLDLMNANVFGQATYGNALALSDDSKFVLLTRQLESVPPYEAFRDLFEDFINAAVFWRKKILPYV